MWINVSHREAGFHVVGQVLEQLLPSWAPIDFRQPATQAR